MTNLDSDWRVLKFVLNKACPIICNLAVGSELCQFGKKSNIITGLLALLFPRTEKSTSRFLYGVIAENNAMHNPFKPIFIFKPN